MRAGGGDTHDKCPNTGRRDSTWCEMAVMPDIILEAETIPTGRNRVQHYIHIVKL